MTVASDIVVQKLHPHRFDGMDKKTAAIVSYILGIDSLWSIFVDMYVSEGVVYSEQKGIAGEFPLSHIQDLSREWAQLCRLADLNYEEAKEAVGLFNEKVRYSKG